MQCVILVGGLGSRLGELTQGRPKPLVEVGGKPFLEILVTRAAASGISHVLLLAGHKASQVEEFSHALGRELTTIKMSVSTEPDPLGTAGALVHAKNKLESDFLLLNGDSIFDFEWRDLITVGLRHPQAEVIMALRFEADTSRYGVVEMKDEQVISFRERGSASGGLINGGVYFMRRSAVDMMPARGSLEKEVLPKLATEKKLAGRVYSGPFIDIGTPSSLAKARMEISS